jgi:regulator of sigma E protease
MTFNIERDGKVYHISLVTEQQKGTKGMEGFVGVYGPTKHSLSGSLIAGVKQTGYWIGMEVNALKSMITGHFSLDDLAGPARIYDMTGQVVAQGLVLVLNWTAFLSVNLAVINLLPLPALDGGRLFFLIIEAVRGKPIEPQKEALVHFIGFAFLMLLMILVTWNDIQNIFMR